MAWATCWLRWRRADRRDASAACLKASKRFMDLRMRTRDSNEPRKKFVPQLRGTSLHDRQTPALPADLLNRAAVRLEISAWLYAFTFFMAAFFPRLIFAHERRSLFGSSVNWLPGGMSILL